MMLCINEISKIKSIFKKMDILSESINFIYDTEGNVKFTLLDRSHALFVDCVMGEPIIQLVDIVECGNFTLDSGEFCKVIERFGKGCITLRYDETNQIVVLSQETNNGDKEYTLRTVEDYNNVRDLPDIDFTFTNCFEHSYFKGMLKDIKLYSQKLRFTVKDNKFTTSASGMMGEFSNSYILDDTIPNEIRSAYNLEKFTIVLSPDKISDMIQISIANDTPLKAVYHIDGLDLTYLLAPMIGDD